MSEKKGISRETTQARCESVRKQILVICKKDFKSSKEVSERLGMSNNTIRAKYLYPMARTGLLELLRPEGSKSGQKYKTA